MPPFLTRIKSLTLLLPPAAVFCGLGLLYPELVTQLGLFSLFFAVFLALPALALGRLLPLGERSLTESLFLGYPPAQVVYFLLVFCGARTGLPWLPLALPFLAAIALFGSSRTAAAKNAVPLPTSTLLLILAVLVPALAVCFNKFLHVSFPTPGHPMFSYHDDVSHAAYVWSAVRSIEQGVAYMLPYVSGFPNFPYHIIHHYSYAFPTFALGLPPMEQDLFLWPPLHWTMLAGAAVTACRRLAGFTVLETGLAMLLLLFSEGVGFYSMPTLQFLFGFHTFFFGMPALLMLLAVLYGYLSGRRTQLCPVHAACCYFVAAGTKANLLPFLPIALLPVFLYRLYKRISVKADCLLALCFSVSAALVYATHYGNLGTGVAQVGKTFKPWSLLMGSFENLGSMAQVIGPFVLLAFIAAEADAVLRHKLRRDRQYHLFLLAFCVSSAVFLKAVNYVGGEFYFYWQARFMALLAFAPLAAHALAWRTRVVAPLVALVLVAGVGLFVAGVGTFASTRLPNVAAMQDPAEVNAKTVDAHEVEGLRWASRNLDHMRTVFTNKDHYDAHYLGGSTRTEMFDYLAFSGLQGYAWPVRWMAQPIRDVAEPRYAWQMRFWDAATKEEREEALRHIEADYYFHSERLSPGDFQGVAGMREVYRNPSLTIYELHGGPAVR